MRSNNNDITWELFTRDERLEAKLAGSLGRNQFRLARSAGKLPTQVLTLL